jgi:hypothetical protein
MLRKLFAIPLKIFFFLPTDKYPLQHNFIIDFSGQFEQEGSGQVCRIFQLDNNWQTIN